MKYYEKIDGLRFVAIAFVFIEHFATDIGHKISAGYYGVDLFFVISGFLITSILLKMKGPFFTCYKNFIGRRTLRIFPIYYIFLLVMLATGYAPCRESFVYFATYVFNYAWIHNNIPVSSMSHLWSLAVEEQFYLIWPFYILALRKHRKTMYATTIAIIAICFFQLTTNCFSIVNNYNFVGLFPRAGSLCLGALGGMLFIDKKLNEELFTDNLMFEWAVVACLLFSLLAKSEFKYVMLALCSFYLVLKAAHSDFRIGFINRFLKNVHVRYIGGISYGIYLFHLPIGYYITTHIISPWWCSIDFTTMGYFSFVRYFLWVILIPLYALLTIGIATLSRIFIEKPILSLKDRFFPYGD